MLKDWPVKYVSAAVTMTILWAHALTVSYHRQTPGSDVHVLQV